MKNEQNLTEEKLKMRNNEEDILQAECYQWFNNKFCLKHHNPRYKIFSVPNGGTRNKIEAMKLKATGVKKGVSDLIIVLHNETHFVEMKAIKGIKSDAQDDFEKTITDLGHKYLLFRDAESFKNYYKEKLNTTTK